MDCANWRAAFPAAQLLVLRSEDFWADPAATYARVTRFLGLPDWSPGGFREYNVGRYSELGAATQARGLRALERIGEVLRGTFLG